jgi:uncharacterized protein YndB with AHSA1/START domain
VSTETKTVTIERDFAYPPEKLWRALTQPHLIAEWLMKNDFALTVGRPFQLRTDPQPNWNGVIDCKVLTIEPNKSLSYRWAALDLESVVTLTLTPTSTGTHLRMEHSGFRADQPRAFAGATYGWNSFLGKLDQLLARPE